MKSQKKWKIYVINHSHTDIGYTERQDKIIRYHFDFIRQAVDILDDIHEKGNIEYEGYKWQCENYWQVENFYSMADENYIRKFEHYVSTGEIGLSGNYFNMTELVSKPVLDDSLKKMEKYGNKVGHKIVTGMCADINGMAWGYSDSLYDHGVRKFYSCLHPHHGMFPLYKKVQPFYWETPSGNKLLVWNGEHYHFGNELFLAPHAGTTYMLHDEFSPEITDNLILNNNSSDTEKKEMEIVTTRVERYLDNLEDEGYPQTIVPLMVSGAVTDNAPPGKEIARRMRELNEHYDGKIQFIMATLEDFFAAVETCWGEIPTYSGDWTDWWADGVGSTPAEVKLYRDAVRKYDICEKMDPQQHVGSEQLVNQAANDMMLYAEHTWGYSSSVSEPWESLVSALELKKGAYAINANTEISKNLDQILAKKGEVTIRQDKPQVYKIINPHDCDLKTKAYLYIEFWEYMDGIRYDDSMPIEVTDCQSGEVLPCQVKKIARATQVEIAIEMRARQEREVRIRLAERIPMTIKNHAYIGAEGVEDILASDGFRNDEDKIETDDFIISMMDGKGIYSIVNKKDGEELVRYDQKTGAFGGVYEVTPIENSPCETRRKMGRNRKSKATRRSYARLTNRRIVENGSVYCAVELDYELDGTRMYSLFVKAYKHQAKIEVMVRVHKESRLEPENLYVSLPFGTNEDAEMYLDKTGCVIRPGIDQLPGSNEDFYLIQNAVIWKKDSTNLCVITKDAPLVTMGNLEAAPIKLCDGNDNERNHDMVYSWIMNNFWETNFKVNLGGFYEFSYTLFMHNDDSINSAFKCCEAENEGLLSCYAEE